MTRGTRVVALAGMLLIGIGVGVAACQPDTNDQSPVAPAAEQATTMATEAMATQGPQPSSPPVEIIAAPTSDAGIADTPTDAAGDGASATGEATDHDGTDEPAGDDAHQDQDEHGEGAPPAIDAEPDLTIVSAVVGGAVVAGGGRHEAALGDVVLIRITSDIADNVHVHGYDYSIPVAVGVPAELKFQADIAGVFEVELEDHKLKLFDLLVR